MPDLDAAFLSQSRVSASRITGTVCYQSANIIPWTAMQPNFVIRSTRFLGNQVWVQGSNFLVNFFKRTRRVYPFQVFVKTEQSNFS